MHRLWDRSYDEQIQYHLDDGRAPNFTIYQRLRIEIAHALIDHIVDFERDNGNERLTFYELGCGAGDITGPRAERHTVIGVDVVPEAQRQCAARWPNMGFYLRPMEEVPPVDVDVLVLCETLEHLDDPMKVVKGWLPRARYAIIGHPLNEPDPPYEPGHIWSYEDADWEFWFLQGGHRRAEKVIFEMGPYKTMVIGSSQRLI